MSLKEEFLTDFVPAFAQIIGFLVKDNAALTLEIEEGEQTISLIICNAGQDYGRVIGKKGKTIMALRNILNAVTHHYKVRAVLLIE